MQRVEQTWIGGFSDKLMLYTWDVVGLILVISLIGTIVELVLSGL